MARRRRSRRSRGGRGWARRPCTGTSRRGRRCWRRSSADGVAQLCARAAAQPGKDPAAELAAWLEELTVYTATHRGLAAALLAGPEGLTAEEICCTDMLLDVLNVLVARASSAGALHAGATTEDLMMLANAIAVANEDDPLTARRVLRLALTGIRP